MANPYWDVVTVRVSKNEEWSKPDYSNVAKPGKPTPEQVEEINKDIFIMVCDSVIDLNPLAFGCSAVFKVDQATSVKNERSSASYTEKRMPIVDHNY